MQRIVLVEAELMKSDCSQPLIILSNSLAMNFVRGCSKRRQ